MHPVTPIYRYTIYLLFLLTMTGLLRAADQPVYGRYVVYGNGLSQILGVAEFEVWSWGKNVVSKRAEDFKVLCLTHLDEDGQQAHLRNLVDGNKNTTERWPSTFEMSAIGMGYRDGALSHCAFEVDLGAEIPVERIELYRSRYIMDGKRFTLFGDLGWRYLLVLDEKRQIVSWETFNIYPADWAARKGHWTFEPKPATGAPKGRLVPGNSLNWLSEAEFVRDFLGKPVVDLVAQPSAADLQRQAAFEQRNSPEAINQLGRDFFRVIDLTRPGLHDVKVLVEQEKYAEALEAFKAPFFETISILDKLHGGFEYTWMSDSNSRAGMRARDLLSGIYADKDELSVKRFVPGLLPPAKFEYPFQMRPLLLAYAGTGDEKYLRIWEAMTDDWAMGFQDAADLEPKKLRDHFLLVTGPVKDNLFDLVHAAKDRPEFVEKLSGATLARYLLPILEEMPVSIWRVTRTATFNHTYNAIPGGWTLSQALLDFRSGQRLEREMEQGFLRLYTDGLYRDGSMVEIGDEGHFAATIHSPGNLYGLWTKHGRPAWLTRAKETYFLDYYRANVISHARNVAPSGVHARWSATQDRLAGLRTELNLLEPHELKKKTDMGVNTFHKLTMPPLLEEQPRAIIDTVYGRGRDTFDDEHKAREQARLGEFFGDYQGPPAIRSDWMPYTGLWYFRGGWDQDASYLHMVKPAIANNMGGAALYPITRRYGGNQFLTTSYRFHDYATPLLTGQAVRVDGLPPAPHEGRFPSGSKQDNFTMAVEKPQPSRWHTDEFLDFGEAIYRGPYRHLRQDYDHKKGASFIYQSDERVGDVTTWRQIFHVLPARLFLQVDRIHIPDQQQHTYTVPNTLVLVQPTEHTDPELDQLYVLPEKRQIITDNPGNGSLTIAFFGQPDLQVVTNPKDYGHNSFRPTTTITHSGHRHTIGKQVRSTWTDQSETVLISALRAELAPERPKPKLPDISTTTVIDTAPATDLLDDFALDEEKPEAAPVILPPKRQAIASTRDLSTEMVAGTQVTMADGVIATLLIARRPPAQLQLGPITIQGEALLRVEQPNQAPIGIALGATSTTHNGAAQQLPANYRYTLTDTLTTTPIRQPIDPPTIGPPINVFSDTTTVTITSASPDVDIYYIAEPLDYAEADAPVSGMGLASVNASNWQRYTGPFQVDADTFVRARAFRKGVTDIPFTAAGTDVSAISYGFFHKRELKPALQPAQALAPGLTNDYLEGRWFDLWTYADVLPAKTSGTTAQLLDVSMRQTDGPFAVRYQAYIDIPESGVYTFYAPSEFYDKTCAPGYDLRVYIDGEEWELGQAWHGRGQWSVPLEKGAHRLLVTFADARAKDLENQRIDLWRHYPYPETTWRGTAPVLEISGPHLERQPMPTSWLKR